MEQDTADVVGPETGGQSGKTGMGGVVLDVFFEVPAIAKKDADDAKKGSDARRDGAVLWGSFRRWRRRVHAALLTLIVIFVK